MAIVLCNMSVSDVAAQQMRCEDLSIDAPAQPANHDAQTLARQCAAINKLFSRREKALAARSRKLASDADNLLQKCTSFSKNSCDARVKKAAFNQSREILQLKKELELARQPTPQAGSLQSQLDAQKIGTKKLQGTVAELEKRLLGLRRKLKKAQEREAPLKAKLASLKAKIKSCAGGSQCQSTTPDNGPANAPATAAAPVTDSCPHCPRLRKISVRKPTRLGLPTNRIEGAKRALPPFRLTLSKDFLLSESEISVGQFKAYLADTRIEFKRLCRISIRLSSSTITVTSPSLFKVLDLPEPPDGDNYPAVCIAKSDALGYAKWLNNKTGKNYDLPSDTEWEYAARGYVDLAPLPPSIDYSLCTMMNIADNALFEFTQLGSRGRLPSFRRNQVSGCDDKIPLLASVGTRTAHNRFGLKDMLGNAAEWTRDCWFDGTAVKPDRLKNGRALIDGNHLDCTASGVRGGSFISNSNVATLWHRRRAKVTLNPEQQQSPEIGYFDVGFRVRRDL